MYSVPPHKPERSNRDHSEQPSTGCLYTIGIIALNLFIIILPTILEKEMFGLLLLNPNPWVVGMFIHRKFDGNPDGWLWVGLAFVIVFAISTFILYWLTIFLYLGVVGLQF